MALSVRASMSKAAMGKVQPRAARASVRPVAQLNATKVAGAVAAAAAVASVVAPVEAAELISTVASAQSGWPFVPPDWAPSVLVPLTGWVIPAVAMGTLFVYIEKEAPPK